MDLCVKIYKEPQENISIFDSKFEIESKRNILELNVEWNPQLF